VIHQTKDKAMLRAILLTVALTLSAVPVAAGVLALSAAPVSAGVSDDALAAYQRGDYAEAMQLWRPLAEQGNALAQYNLGVMYANGTGAPQDYVEAVRWYRMAAEQGFDYAQHNLGFMYANGEGVPQDYVLAHMWLNLAVAQGNDDAKAARDIVAKLMTSEQVAEAQRMAREWKPK
jgi:TPR repeat protein